MLDKSEILAASEREKVERNERIVAMAKEILKDITGPEDLLELIAELSSQYGLDLAKELSL